MEKQKNNSLRIIVNWIIFFVITAGVLFISSKVMDIFFFENHYLLKLSIELKSIGIKIFNFVSPFIKLIICLLILDWILYKLGINLSDKLAKLDLNWQLLVSIGIIVFIISILAIMGGIGFIHFFKSIIFLGVGFYLGMQKINLRK